MADVERELAEAAASISAAHVAFAEKQNAAVGWVTLGLALGSIDVQKRGTEITDEAGRDLQAAIDAAVAEVPWPVPVPPPTPGPATA